MELDPAKKPDRYHVVGIKKTTVGYESSPHFRVNVASLGVRKISKKRPPIYLMGGSPYKLIRQITMLLALTAGLVFLIAFAADSS